MKLLLHVCCGPCSIIPIDEFLSQGYEVVCVFENSNINTEEEFEKRNETLQDYLLKKNVSSIKAPYNHEDWEREVGTIGLDKKERCKACYALRFKNFVKIAKENGADCIASTLTISPYQFTDQINFELEKAAKQNGLDSITSDFRDKYKQSIVLSRELDMYRQNYCGCSYSVDEANQQRLERKQQREARRRND